MAGTLLPAPFTYFTDDEGAPLVGGTVTTYITGTSTLSPVYHDAALLTAWDNPLTIPADGKVRMYQGTVTLKMVVKDADGNVLDTYDPIQSTAESASSGAGIAAFTFGGAEDFPITVTSLPSGATAAAIHPGSSFVLVDSDNLTGDYLLQGMLQAGAAETVTASLVNVSQGSPDTAIISISSTDTVGELKQSTVITFAAGGTARTYAVKTKTSAAAAPSYAWGFALVKDE